MNAPASRRGFLAAATTAVATTGAAAVMAAPSLPNPAGGDAELIALCYRAIGAHLAYNEACEFCEDHPALPALADIENETALAIADIPARTREGVAAKARVLKCRMPKASGGADIWPHANESDHLAWSLASDILAHAGGDA